ncbi:hypothetical protein CAL7716_088020 [Calothrix sp. PCC 7716]|nr:hypothetical protein CAL7716_088020 [Calothrix sp. PCC 7716]
MKFDELDLFMLMDASDIEYSNISEDMLVKLALCDELYIANYALAELSARDSNQASVVAWQILSTLKGDYYLQAAALSVLFDTDKGKVLDYINKQVQHFDLFMLNEVMQLMVEKFSDFATQNTSKIVSIIFNKLKKLDDKQGLIDKEVKDNFFSLYSIAKMTVADV